MYLGLGKVSKIKSTKYEKYLLFRLSQDSHNFHFLVSHSFQQQWTPK